MKSFDEFITYKELLLKDLCSRIPYKVKCQVYDDPVPYTLSGIIPSRVHQELYFEEMDYKECDGFIDIKYSKPYLFPLSSMTEEEIKEYKHLAAFSGSSNGAANFVDWLNVHHFDYQDLIPKGLGNDTTKLNIY